MNSCSEQLRFELAQLVNDQADAAEKRSLTEAEGRDWEKRRERMRQVCDELHRIATHTGQEKEVAFGKEELT